MLKTKAIIFFSVLMITGLLAVFISSCKKKSDYGRIVFTQVPGKSEDFNYVTGYLWRIIPHAQILSIDPDDPEGSIELLTNEFCSACSPEISYDGRSMLFAAQKNQDDPWQIWEMNLKNLKTRQITASGENCTDPAYLPDNRLLYSKLVLNDSLRAGYSLYTCNPDGSDERRITFNPGTYFASSVLKDGRILSISRQIYPEHGKEIFMVLRPDGTKAQMFYKSSEGKILFSRPRETNDGEIVFVESESRNKEGSSVVSVRYNSPLHSMNDLSSEIKGCFYSAFPMRSGMLLVSWRISNTDRYALYEYNPGSRFPGKVIYTNPDYDVYDAVIIEEHNRPRKLPSEVDMGVKTGLLMCQDINFSGLQSSGNASYLPLAERIEILGINDSLGVVKVEDDGSFYLKVMADRPFRIQTVDKNGHILKGPCDWIWLRPNERRGCTGCHEDPEMVPCNRIPLSVKKSPVIIPVQGTMVKEKGVELE
jgi:hypothetical protein